MGNEFWAKNHGEVLAVCDKELLGKTVGKTKVNEAFYKGDLINEENVKEMIAKSKNINLIGKNSVKIAIKLNLAGNKSIMKVGDAPHLQIVVL